MRSQSDRVSPGALAATVAAVRAAADAATAEAVAAATAIDPPTGEGALGGSGSAAEEAAVSLSPVEVLVTSARARPPRGRDALWRHMHCAVGSRAAARKE